MQVLVIEPMPSMVVVIVSPGFSRSGRMNGRALIPDDDPVSGEAGVGGGAEAHPKTIKKSGTRARSRKLSFIMGDSREAAPGSPARNAEEASRLACGILSVAAPTCARGPW